MAIENISPEERLFKIIQENKNSPPKEKSVEAGKTGIPAFFESVRHFFAGIRRQRVDENHAAPAILGRLSARLQSLDPKAINKVLIVVLAVLVILVVYYSADKRYNVTKITGAVLKAPAQIPRAKPIEEFKPPEFYMDEVRKRDIFHEFKIEQKPVKSTLAELAKDLSLTGIYQGAYPEAMIEDKTAKRTYFLKVDDDIKGIKIKSILKDKVILQYGEEELEIR